MDLAWLPAVTAPGAAIIGGYVGYRLGRSRVQVVVDRVSISPSRHASLVRVAPSLVLLNQVQLYPEQLPTLSENTVPERTYVTYLNLLLAQLEKSEERALAEESRAEKFRAYAQTNEFGILVDQYRLAQVKMWATAELVAARAQVNYARPDPYLGDDIQAVKHYEISTDEEGDYYVDVGPGALGFSWTKRLNPAGRERSKEFAARVSRAFAYRDREEVSDYFDVIRTAARQTSQSARAFAAQVEAELAQFARFKVEFIVSNSGRSAVSVSSELRATVGLKKYTYQNQGLTETIESDLVIALRGIEADNIPNLEEAALKSNPSTLPSNNDSAPILVPAGGALRMVAVSTLRVADFPHGGAIPGAFIAAERDFRLELGEFQSRRSNVVRRSSNNLHRLKSGSIPFRQLDNNGL